MCNNTYANVSSRERHIKSLHNEDPVAEIKNEIKAMVDLKTDQPEVIKNGQPEVIENDQPEKQTPITNPSNFECPLCDEIFANVSIREKHIKSIHNNDPATDIKNEVTDASDEYSPPKQDSSQTKNYKCPLCNKPFKGKAALKEHITMGHNITMDMFKVFF